MLMNLYFWIALLYSNLLHMDFVWELYHSLNSSAFLTMFMPLLAWLFGVCENETFIMSLVTTLCLMTFMYATSILVFHGKNTLRGRTTQEVKRDEGHIYDLGWKKNLNNAMGKNWMFAWLCPLIPSPLPCDGFEFETREMQQLNGKAL